MKVLQINAVYGYKSTGVIVKDIENILINNGHKSYVAYQTALDPTENYVIDIKDEMEFNYNILDKKLRHYCNGFVDMMFKNGEYYSK